MTCLDTSKRRTKNGEGADTLANILLTEWLLCLIKPLGCRFARAKIALTE